MVWINGEGTYQDTTNFEISGENLQEEVGDVKADRKALTLEGGTGLVGRHLGGDPLPTWSCAIPLRAT
jgi:hypothetical protein